MNSLQIQELIYLVKNHHFETYVHSLNVANITRLIIEELNLLEEDSSVITLAALLHDVGQIKVNKEILNKSDTLTESEWSIIKKHPIYGCEILEQMTSFRPYNSTKTIYEKS